MDNNIEGDWHHIRLDETDSTNHYLKELLNANSPEEFIVVSARFQTRGRGQMGNSWFSESGQNLLFSFLIYPNMVVAAEQFIISQVVSLALAEVLLEDISDISIKWPNDIYYKDEKIAGILIENNLMGRSIDSSVIGIGLNVNQSSFPNYLENPTSMRIVAGREFDLNDVLNRFMTHFMSLYNEVKQGLSLDIVHRYMSLLYRSDGYYWYEDDNGAFEAKILNVMPSGHLWLGARNEPSPRVYAFKEVRFVIK